MKIRRVLEAKYYDAPHYYSVTFYDIPDKPVHYLETFLVVARDPEHAKEIVQKEFPGAGIQVELVDNDYLDEFGYNNIDDFLRDLDTAIPTKLGQYVFQFSGT